MNKFTKFTKPLWWLMSLLTIAFVTGCGSSSSDNTNDKAITAYSLAGVSGIINQTSKTISVAVPYGTNVTSQIATFSSTGASVKVSNVTQSSATTANNFTGPVAYVVTAANGTTAIYTVIVSASTTTAKTMTSFNLAGVPGVINETAKTIAVTVPFGTTVSSLAANFTATGASVKVATVVQTSGVTLHSFSSPVVYTVVAVDTTSVDYTVTVTVATNFAKSITAYSLAGVVGVIDETAKTITVTMPFGTNVTALVATFTSTGTGPVTILGVTQVSAVTANNFTTPQTYKVVAANNTTASYIVTAGVAQNPAKAITAFSLNSVTGTINETTKAITVVMPFDTTDITALVATFTTTGASVKVSTVTQISGTTAHNFNSPISYLVTAADTTSVTYTVTVSIASASVTSCTGGASCVPLGGAGSFVMLAQTMITGGGSITGDIGVSAASGSTITVPCASMLTGKVFQVDDAYADAACSMSGTVGGGVNKVTVDTAVADMGTAYTTAAGLVSPAPTVALGAGNISGMTLSPGIYKWSTSVLIYANNPNAIAGGDTNGVTLDCTIGGSTSVFVFQIAAAQTLTLGLPATPASITLTNGCLPSNIFWQVGGDVTITPASVFRGNILSATQVAMQAGAVLHGRALAQTAVTMISNTVSP